MQKQSQKKPLQKRQPSQQSIEKPAKPNKTPVDYQVLLLSLADEYLSSAHRHGTKMALTNRAADVEEYYKLIATGLGCLEAVLKVCPTALLLPQRSSRLIVSLELASATSQGSLGPTTLCAYTVRGDGQ